MSGDLAATVSAWAAGRPDVHAVVLLGSRARAEPPADEWSDHDFVLVVGDPAPFLAATEWVAEIGPWLLSFVEPAAESELSERRVLFADGADADFSILPLDRVAAVAEQARSVLARGVRVLVDKGGVAGPFAVARPVEAGAPMAGYGELVNDFWYHAILAARKLRRGELYVAVQGVNCALRPLLVRAIALEAAGCGRDAWHEGRFLERWADPRWLERLPDTVARHDARAAAAALVAACDVFADVCAVVEERAGAGAPVDLAAVRGQLDAVLS